MIPRSLCFSAFTGAAMALGAGVASAQQPEVPRPEHPQPQAVRSSWVSLNGTWEFAETNEDQSDKFLSAAAYPDKIKVPFTRESPLSGLGRTELVKNVWYRRTFAVPEDWRAPRVRLHVGACDYVTRVWVNGKLVGEHIGGSVAFSYDVTEAIKRDGENTVIIHAFDETTGKQPLGKQSPTGKGYGIFYTPTTGIWQPVWIEGVGDTYVKDFQIEPDPTTSSFHLNAHLDGVQGRDTKLIVTAYLKGKKVGQAQREATWRDNRLTVTVSDKQLWMPDSPTLYDMQIELMRGGHVIDRVMSYAGLRDVKIDGMAILINSKPIFQRLILDQGFYPDGIWTAPSDEALRKDIELSMAAGFNGARLHQKVFEPRFLYHADKMGYLVWGEFPSFNADYADPQIDSRILNEWVEIVQRDRNHPSIIGWCPFNETPKEATRPQPVAVELTRALDPGRPVLETSGWTHSMLYPEVLDAHDYEQTPQVMRERYEMKFTLLPERYGVSPRKPVPFFVSEYGGIAYDLEKGGWGYNKTPLTEEEFFERYKGLADAQLDNRYLFGLCYTQLTNVEQEQNGVYYYDRRPKFATEKLHAIMSRKAAYEENPPLASTLEFEAPEWTTLVGSRHDGDAAAWQYTESKPADAWATAAFDASAWKQARAPFGRKEDKGRPPVNVDWTSKDIWLRQQFEFDGKEFDRAVLLLQYDNGVELYLNGEKVFERGGWNHSYDVFNVTEAVKKSIKNGKNTLAVHVHQEEGGQYIDLALLVGRKAAK